jgi:tetratricopeptide (TPR) repeat protein
MKLVESHLVAQQKMVLSVSASTQAERLRAAAHATQTRIWNLPYQTLERRSHLGLDGVLRRLDSFLPFYSLSGTPLYKGRVLHLKGRFFDTQGAIECYQAARPATEDLARGLQDKARAYYETILLPRIKDLPADKQKEASLRAQQEAVGAIQMEFTSILRGKIDASYWLGLIAYEQENYPSAIDYFRKRTLEVTPNGPRTAGAHYNLARSYEALGQTQKAVEEYEAGVFSLADYGNALRARWLNELRPPANAKRGEKEKK